MEAVENNGQELKPVITTKAEDLPKIEIDFSKPPENVLSNNSQKELPSKNETALADHSTKNQTTYENTNLSVDDSKKNFPSIINLYSKFDNVNAYVKAISDVAAVATVLSIPASFYINLSPDFMTKAIVTSATAVVLLKAVIETRFINNIIPRILARKELENRMEVSEIMTVSRAKNEPNSTTDTLIATTDKAQHEDQQKFYGELHFVNGISKEKGGKYEKKDTKFRVIDALKGLNNIAEMCKNNDPRIAGINNFIGYSDIVKPSFSRFGFEVVPEESVKRPSRIQKFYSWIKSQKEIGTKKQKTEDMYYAVINRETLIQNQENYSRLINSLTRNQSSS